MPKYFHTLFQLNRIREFDLENTGNLSLDLRSLAAEGFLLSRISEFGLNINREFAARTCSLATEGTQEFPPLKKTLLIIAQEFQFLYLTFCRAATTICQNAITHYRLFILQ